jgi:hypothetical protein
MRSKNLLISRMRGRQPIAMWLCQRAIGDRITHWSRFADRPAHCWAQTVSAPA